MNEWSEIACPTCRKKGAWFAGAYGPFCSRRCKLVDLGKWLNEEHVLSEPLRPEHLLAPEDADPAASPAPRTGSHPKLARNPDGV
jgi:hypothetical protein